MSRVRVALVVATVAAVAAAVVAVVAALQGRTTESAVDPAGDPPAIAEGWRGVTFRDVVVQVPEEWGDRSALGEDWCADVPREPLDGPFVALESSDRLVFSIGCPEQPAVPPGFGPEPQDQWVPHLTLVDTTVEGIEPVQDGTSTHDGWTLRARTIGDVQVRLLTDAATEPVAEEVMAGAERSEVGALGCDTTSPAQEPPAPTRPVFAPAGDLTAVDGDDVDRLLVCQYDRIGTGAPGLTAEQVLGTEAARDWVAAVAEAPRRGGPDSPGDCSDPWASGSALAVHPLDAEGERLAAAYLTADACAGNGLRDSTTTYELTAGTCAPVYDGRVVWWGGPQRIYAVCARPDA